MCSLSVIYGVVCERAVAPLRMSSMCAAGVQLERSTALCTRDMMSASAPSLCMRDHGVVRARDAAPMRCETWRVRLVCLGVGTASEPMIGVRDVELALSLAAWCETLHAVRATIVSIVFELHALCERLCVRVCCRLLILLFLLLPTCLCASLSTFAASVVCAEASLSARVACAVVGTRRARS